jgi:hypothetical protein
MVTTRPHQNTHKTYRGNRWTLARREDAQLAVCWSFGVPGHFKEVAMDTQNRKVMERHKGTKENNREEKNCNRITTKKQMGTVRKRTRAGGEGRTPAYALRSPHYELTDNTRKHDSSMVTQGWLGDKRCLVTLDTGAYVTVARTAIAAIWPEREENPGFTLHTVSGEFLPILKQFMISLNLGRRPLRMRDFMENITDKLILGLDKLRAYEASVDVGLQKLRLDEEELSLCSPGAGPCPSSLVVAKENVIRSQREGEMMARMEITPGVENGLVEPNPQAHQPEGIQITRTVIQDRQEIPVRIVYTTHGDQNLTRGSPLAQCELVTMVIPPWGWAATDPRPRLEFRGRT